MNNLQDDTLSHYLTSQQFLLNDLVAIPDPCLNQLLLGYFAFIMWHSSGGKIIFFLLSFLIFIIIMDSWALKNVL